MLTFTYRLTGIGLTLIRGAWTYHRRGFIGVLVALALIGAVASAFHVNVFPKDGEPIFVMPGSAPASGPLPAVLVRSLTCFVPDGSGIAEVTANPEDGCPTNGTVATSGSKWTCPKGMFTDGRVGFRGAPDCWVDGETCVGNADPLGASPQPFTGRRGAECHRHGSVPQIRLPTGGVIGTRSERRRQG